MPGRDIWLCGGAELVRQALELDLIDELRLTIIPTLLGAGIPLFGGLTAPKLLELVSHRAEMVWWSASTAEGGRR